MKLLFCWFVCLSKFEIHFIILPTLLNFTCTITKFTKNICNDVVASVIKGIC